MTKEELYTIVIQSFQKNNPNPKSELDFENPFQLLIAVILSAQCTDKRVNLTTPTLFQKYPTPQALATASYEDVLYLIRSISYPNNKAKYLIEMSQQLVAQFNSEVPQKLEQLQTLKGVGRKTANVVSAVAFHQNTMPVDTHVFRVANRIGLTQTTTPLATEKELIKHIPEKLLAVAHHWLLLHGRYTCTAISPKCEICHLKNYCKTNSEKKRKKK